MEAHLTARHHLHGRCRGAEDGVALCPGQGLADTSCDVVGVAHQLAQDVGRFDNEQPFGVARAVLDDVVQQQAGKLGEDGLGEPSERLGVAVVADDVDQADLELRQLICQ